MRKCAGLPVVALGNTIRVRGTELNFIFLWMIKLFDAVNGLRAVFSHRAKLVVARVLADVAAIGA